MSNLIIGRKMVAGMVMLAIGLGTVIWLGEIPPNLLSLLEFLFGAFAVANTAEHISNTVEAVKTATPVPVEVPNTFNELEIRTIIQQNEALAANVSQIQQALVMIITKTGIDKS